MAPPVRAAATAPLAALGAFYIRLVYLTTRWTVEGYEAARPALEGPGGVVLVTWHGRLFVAPVLAPKTKRCLAMVSRSRDGELFAAILRRWGVGAVRGSTDDRVKRRPKGGGAAFSQALDALSRTGALVGLTPDGPRGPRHKARPGTARLAAAAQVQI
ncbi:MAG TPA: DUF374 domain-containing protein, partial [Thermohalobaculum sp.]|nr:DUF374 domain-containing protein [Thermohalobaculum sp.]